MTSTANAEPKGSEPSSTDCTSTSPDSGLRCTKNRRLVHLEHVNGGVVWDDRDYEPECQHPDKRYAGALCDGPNDRKSFLYYACPDCMTTWKEEVPEPMKGDFLRCRCNHFQMNHRAFTDGGCRNCACTTFRLEHEHEHEHESAKRQACACGQGGCEYCDPEDPPLTPEEEEELPGDEGCACGEPETKGTVHRTDGPCYIEIPRPPQPDRRPPYAVAYSVQGHLYEVALPGDATVVALDGALVISHRLGPVAAICQVLPVINEESH